jgi:signal transduction histidine kinase
MPWRNPWTKTRPMPISTPDPTAPGADRLDALRSKQQRLLEGLADSQRQFKHLARSVFRVQEEERRRLARELHDGLGQSLTALKHRLSAIAEQAGPAAEIGDALHAALTLCADILEETRELSRLLRPQILDDLGLAPALRWLGRSIGESGGPAVTVDVELEGLDLDSDLATLLFRAAQEALANTMKHAQAQQVRLALWRESGHLLMSILDDGRGFDPVRARTAASAGAGTGLGSLYDRVRVYDGSMNIDSSPGHGCEIRLRIPVNAVADHMP